MCGLFGVVLPRDSTANPRLDLTVLGVFAEERGVDAAGLATLNRERGWSTSRTTGPFTNLVRRPAYAALTEQVQTALGHTRAATQGGRSIAQASPLAIGPLLGTHNGNLDPDSIPHRPSRRNSGTTDSQLLFAALNTAHRDGRLRLARTLTIPSNARVWLARGGLSPLAVLIDGDGAVWWASNPGWLRGIRPDGEIRLLHEGTVWVLTPRRSRVTVQHLSNFKPTVRPYDERTAAVWRGFTPADRRTDQTRLRHRVGPAVLLACPADRHITTLALACFSNPSNLQERKRTMDTNHWVGAAPFRRHLRDLLGETSLSWRLLAAHANVAPRAVRTLLHGRPQSGKPVDHIHIDTARALMRLDIDDLLAAEERDTCAGEPRHLFRILLTLGYSCDRLGSWLTADDLRVLSNSSEVWCSAGTRARVQACHDLLTEQPAHRRVAYRQRHHHISASGPSSASAPVRVGLGCGSLEGWFGPERSTLRM